MPGLGYKNTGGVDGGLLYRADGTLMEGCCCGPTPIQCATCVTAGPTDTTPATVRVTFTGITPCTCFKMFGALDISGQLLIDPNGTYDLPQISACTWQYTFPDPTIVAQFWDSASGGATCPGDGALAPTLAAIQYGNSGTTATLTFEIQFSDRFAVHQNAIVYSRVKTGLSDPRNCKVSVSMGTSGRTACDSASPGLLGIATGGTATALGL